MVEKEIGERNFGLDSLKARLNCNMGEKVIVAADVFSRQLSVHFGSISFLGRMRTPLPAEPATPAGLQLDSGCSAAGGVRIRPRGRNNGTSGEITWTRKHLSQMLFVVAGEVKR